MSSSLAQLEREILTRYLQIPPSAKSPNYFELLGLNRNEADRFAVQLAGELRKDIVRAITDPRLQPAIPAVLAQLDVALECLLSRAERQAYERGLSAPTVPVSPAKPQLQRRPRPDPVPSPAPRKAISADPLGLGALAPADEMGRPVLRPGTSNAGNRTLLVLAGVIGGGTLVVLLIVIIVTRILRQNGGPVENAPPVPTSAPAALG